MRFHNFVFFLTLAARAFAQNVDGLDIRGVVNEAGLNLGVAGAEVTIYEFNANRERTLFATTATDAHGTFQVHPTHFGDYYVEVKKLGYVNMYSWEGPTTPQPETSGTLLTLSRERLSEKVGFVLMRPGEITGRLIDENQKPVTGMMVQIAMPGWSSTSSLSLGRLVLARTFPDGSFVAKAMIPGDYVVRISPVAGPKLIAPPQLTKDEFDIVDQDLETLYWPSGHDNRSASPVRVSPGASLNLGNIEVRKAPYYRVRLSGGCRPGEVAQLLIRDPTSDLLNAFSLSPAAQTSCDEVLVTHLRPGSYQFVLLNQKGWAMASVDIRSRNEEIALTISEPADIAGRVTAAEGVALPALDNVRVESKPAMDIPIRGNSSSTPDAKGVFTMKNLQGPRHQIVVTGLSGAYYVSEIRANGVASKDGLVSLSKGSALEIVLDNKPAVLVGSVTEDDKPAGRANVYLVKWPSIDPVGSPVTTDADGKFQIAGLSPGEYRALAVSSVPLPDGMQFSSDSLNRLWSGADKVTLERGSSRSVSLKLVDPMR